MLYAAVAFLALLPAADAPVEADFVIRGAMIYDGSDQPGQTGDLAIQGDRVVAVGSLRVAGDPKVLAGAGFIAAPGFIDLHTHSDVGGITDPQRRANRNYLTQGVTTVVTGNCGGGPVEVAGFLKKLDEGKVGSNVLHLVPHNSVRLQVMGNVNRPPTADELHRMKRLVGQGMRDGAWGLSTGLEYTPGSYSQTEELVELAKVVAAHQGVYATHMRDEDAGLLSSVEETLAIGRRAGVPVHISHLKAGSRVVWGKSVDAIALIQQARDRGQQVTADQYPYTAWSTALSTALVPARFLRGTQQEYRARLEDTEQGPTIRKAIADAIARYDAATTFQIGRYGKRPDWQGKTLGAIAALEKKPVVDIVWEIERNGGASVVGFTMNEEDIRLIMQQPFVATASDGRADAPPDTVPPPRSFGHPRSYGTFPRKIGRYALEEKVVSLEQALRSASGLPADILRLSHRGYMRPGYYADIVVFDPKTFRDTATFDKPHQYAPGIRHLFVNGVLTIWDGKYTGALAGRALRHPGQAR